MKTKTTLMAAASAVVFALSAFAEPLVKDGDSIAFLGDSITEFGNWPAGYVNLVIKGFEVAGVKVVKIPAGISGHRSNDMLARVDQDVIAKKPVWMTLSCGVNDVWHQDWDHGVALEDYKRNISEILDRVIAAGIKPLILTATMIQEDDAEPKNSKLKPYNDFLREEARRRNLPLADLNELMHQRLAEIRAKDSAPGNKLTRDGVHMAFEGNMMMAEGVLRAFGVDCSKFDAIRAAWLDMPGSREETLQFSDNEWRALGRKAAAAGKSVHDYILSKIEE